MSDEEYNLEKSTQIVGQLYPVLLAKDGSVIDGNHRGKKWKTLKLDHIDTEEKKLIARAISNWHRRHVEDEEKRKWINGLARIYEKQGLKVYGETQGNPNEILGKIAERTGLHESTIGEYLSEDFKQEYPEKTRESHKPRMPASERIEHVLGEDYVDRHREEVKQELLKSPDFQREVVNEIKKTRGKASESESCPVLPPLTPDPNVEPLPENYTSTLTVTCPKCGHKFEW